MPSGVRTDSRRKPLSSSNLYLIDFDVKMEVEMDKVGDLLVPKFLRYKGNFKVIFKKRERGEFTATLFDFKK